MDKLTNEKTIFNFNTIVSVTDTDSFKHVLAMVGVIYRNTRDNDLKVYIISELRRALGEDWDVDGVLNGCRR